MDRWSELLLALSVGVFVASASLAVPGPGGSDEPAGSPPALAPVVGANPVPAADAGIAWSELARAPDETRREAVARLVATVAGVGGTAGLVCLVGSVLLLATAGSRGARGVAVRSALGATPSRIRRALLRGGLGGTLSRGWGWGLLLGVAGALLLRTTWPHVVGGGSGPSWWVGVLLAGSALPVVLALRAALVPVRNALRRVPVLLSAGGRATDDPRAGSFRRVITVLQVAGALVLLSGTAIAWSEGPAAADGDGDPGGGVSGAAATLLLPLAIADQEPAGDPAVDPAAADGQEEDGAAVGSAAFRRDRWDTLLARVRATPTLHAESIATPGGWTGVGTRDFALAECGACVRGGLYVPLSGEMADHHVVSPGFFAAAGLEVVSGRAFGAEDGGTKARIAVVSRSYGLRNFEDGEPLGRRVRIGTNPDWYTVVGVVEDMRAVGPGAPGRRTPAVYLSAAQHPPDVADLSVRSDLAPGEVEELAGPLVEAAGLRLRDRAIPLAALRSRERAPLSWGGGWVASLGVLALVGALTAVHRVARVEIEARSRELAIRAAVGASPGSLLRWVLARWFRVVAWGTVLALPGVVMVAALFRIAGASPPLFAPATYGGLVALVGASALLGVLPAGRAAGGTDPGRALADE